jgi:5'-3' exonuclease
MGVDGLSKLVKPVREVKLQEFKNTTFAIDAMIELNRAFKGQVVLTNKEGEKTHHIRSILALILKFESYGIKQIWVFDHDAGADEDPNEHFKYKTETLEKRRQNKLKEKDKLWHLQQEQFELETNFAKLESKEKTILDDLLDGLSIGKIDSNNAQQEKIQKRIDTPHRKEINDLKIMFDYLGIEWVEAPITYEGEAICGDLVKYKIADYAFTTDLDALLYGAPFVIKRVGYGKEAKYMLYDLDRVIEDLNIGYEDLIKIGLCLGTDANTKGVHNIGVKTVLTKFETATDWTAHPYAELIEMFSRTADVKKLTFNNISTVSFTSDQQKKLINWLVTVQSFDRDRTTKQFSNALNNIKTGDVFNKTPIVEIKWDSISIGKK